MRAARLEYDGHRCRTCRHDGSAWCLEVHHLTYDRIGHEDLADLITLCRQCHEAVTDIMRRRREVAIPELSATERPTPVAIPERVSAAVPTASGTERPTPAIVPDRALPSVANVCGAILRGKS